MTQKLLPSVLMPLLALCACSLPATAGNIFTDLGPSGDVYNSTDGWTMGGSTAIGGPGESYTLAQLFTVAGSGSLSVSQIDLAVNNANDSLDTFYASVWTDNAGLPGAEVAGAYWSLSTSTPFGSCCGLVSVSGITGVSLNGGQQYFMILGPLSLSEASLNPWMLNSQNITGLALDSTDGGATWADELGGTSVFLGGFDVLGASDPVLAPEPGSLFLLGTGLAGLLCAYRRTRASGAR